MSCWRQPSLALVGVLTEGVNQQSDAFSVFLSLSATLPFKYMNKYLEKPSCSGLLNLGIKFKF